VVATVDATVYRTGMNRKDRERIESRKKQVEYAKRMGFDVSISEAARQCGVNKSTVWRWNKGALLSSHKIDGGGGGTMPGIYVSLRDAKLIAKARRD